MDSRYDRLRYGLDMEEAALRWFCEMFPGQRLIARNYRWKGGELDLILEETRGAGNVELVFIEVRSRLRGSWTTGIESIRFPKQFRLERTIRRFLAGYRGSARTVRFDVLAWDGKNWMHYPDIRLSAPSY